MKDCSSDVASSLTTEQRAPIFVQCESCRGSGEPYDGVTCSECDGFGTVEVEGSPIILEDLETDE